MKRLLALLLLCSSAQAQEIQGSGSASGAPAVTSSSLDAAFGSTRGSILERGASLWQIVPPGINGVPWVSNGAGADPSYQALTSAGIAAATIVSGNIAAGGVANSNLANVPGFSVKCNFGSSSASPQDCSYLVVNAKDHGVKCDGVTDDTAAIGVADAAATTAQAALQFPGGTCIVSSALVPATSARWLGSSFERTVISTNSATANIITITNSFVTIENIGFASTVTRTGGWFVDIGAGQFRLFHFFMNQPFEGIRIQDGVSVINIEDGEIFEAAALGLGIRVGSGTGIGPVALSVRFVIIQANPAARAFAGILLVNCGDLTLVDNQLLSNQNGMDIAPGNGQTVVSVHSFGTFYDSNSNAALVITPTGTGFVGRSNFTTSWFASTSAGSNIIIAPAGTATVNGISFTDYEVYGAAAANGVAITQAAGTTVANISFLGGRNAGNITGFNINGLTSGLIADSVIGAAGGFGANTNGIVLAGTIGHLYINNNDLTGSTTAYSSSATGSIFGNNVPWTTYAPSLNCGTATFTVNSAHYTTIGKITSAELDFTITAVGTCIASTPLTFIAPTSPQNAGVMIGTEINNSGVIIGCSTRTISNPSMTCQGNALRAWANNDRVQMTGTYENQ